MSESKHAPLNVGDIITFNIYQQLPENRKTVDVYPDSDSACYSPPHPNFNENIDGIPSVEIFGFKISAFKTKFGGEVPCRSSPDAPEVEITFRIATVIDEVERWSYQCEIM